MCDRPERKPHTSKRSISSTKEFGEEKPPLDWVFFVEHVTVSPKGSRRCPAMFRSAKSVAHTRSCNVYQLQLTRCLPISGDMPALLTTVPVECKSMLFLHKTSGDKTPLSLFLA